ncbi:ComF family protein [Sulfurimonas sp.]|uniref:phosphoribosyltransferase-like protein n=1 Tax=Sulfurimonas sp. TaxID=2022749 RepID=UPI002AB1F272|nr:ComF family protein [Sulfurimonas sp.]
MKCLLCEKLSFAHICTSCQETFLTPSIYKRKILNNIEVISFYKYKDIKDLLHTKHTDLGYYIYNILALNSFVKFAKEFQYTDTITSIAVDDNVKSGYSHTAILNKALKNKYINPQYNKLRAKNDISYSGKSKEFRLLNPRNFSFHNSSLNDIILIDDIITTGSTLTQATQVIQNSKKEVLFCLTLADASLK